MTMMTIIVSQHFFEFIIKEQGWRPGLGNSERLRSPDKPAVATLWARTRVSGGKQDKTDSALRRHSPGNPTEGQLSDGAGVASPCVVLEAWASLSFLLKSLGRVAA